MGTEHMGTVPPVSSEADYRGTVPNVSEAEPSLGYRGAIAPGPTMQGTDVDRKSVV